MKNIIILVCLINIVAVTQAQSDCESRLKAADEYYNKKDYDKAAKMYKMVQKYCDNNYGETVSKLYNCNNKLEAEDTIFEKCTTELDCEGYLSTYPYGKYVIQVRDKLSELKEIRLMEEEDEAYANCITVSACEEYLSTYPNGRYVVQVKDKQLELELEEIRLIEEEDEAFANCTTEYGCDYYLQEYPNGRYYYTVLVIQNELAEERLQKEHESDVSDFINIRRIEFANVDINNDIIDDYVSTLYASDIKYLKPKIVYDGLLDIPKQVTIDCKIIKPNGILMSGSSSPIGYTYSNTFWIQTGSYNYYELSGWGNQNGGSFVSGIYKFELWYDGNLIYQTTFTLQEKENALSRGNWRSALRKCNDYVTKMYDNSHYKGQLNDGVRSGLGMYYWFDGVYYIGNWRLGKKNGEGMYLTDQGHIVNCPDCAYYVGYWSDGDMSGKGTCYDKFGNLIYYGNFVNDTPTETYPTLGMNSFKFECIEYTSGNYYLGETYGGKRHGIGVYIWKDGGIWYGHWTDGERDGYGIYMPYQGSVSTGTWKGDTKQ